MKKNLFVLFALLIASITFTNAQSKKDIEMNLANCTTIKDSIQKMYAELSETYDSISKACIAYDSMYIAVKEKVFKYDFDPANMSELIDSLQAESFSGITLMRDSISVLQQENAELKEKIESSSANTGDNTNVVSSLKQLKELLDEEIISQEEYDTKRAELIGKL